MSLNFYYMSFSILNNICMLWNFYYMSFNFSNNIYMLGAHFIYVTLSKHPTTWTCFWFLSAVLLDPCYHPTQYPISQCHNAIIHVLWLGVTIIFQLRHHRETTCHSRPSVSDNLANSCGWRSSSHSSPPSETRHVSGNSLLQNQQY